jgi:multidrug resistance efflux pump
VLLAGLLVPIDDKVGGRARLEGRIQRVLVAPVDGFVKAVHARPGDAVREGQILVELAQEELGLDRQKWASELAQYENAYAAAFARSDRTDMVVNQARADEARARLALSESRLGRARLAAPFTGLLIQGDLSRSLGAPVRRGDVLMTVAPRDAYRVIVEVDERDIARLAIGQTGDLAVSALPWDSLPIKVERITPLATAVEGANVFEVEAALTAPAAHLQPGLQGTARIVVGQRALLPRLAERLAAEVRQLTWSWWG